MKKGTGLVCALLLLPFGAMGHDCWRITDLRGTSFYEKDQHRASDDAIDGSLTVCFSDASVTGTNIRMVRLGTNTIAGIADDGSGWETIEVYQIDRGARKLYYSKSMVGVGNRFPFLSDGVKAFVGNAEPIAL